MEKFIHTPLVALLALPLGGCMAVGFSALNTPSYLLNDHEVLSDLSYGPGPQHRLDLYLPAADVAAQNKLVVFVYGGGWTSGEKNYYYFVADALTSAGYAVAIPDYTKYPQGRFPEFVDDVALAVAWLSQNMPDYAEVDDVILMGHSAGAHIGALLVTDHSYLARQGLQPDAINGFIGIAGPYAFTPEKPKYQNVFNNLENYAVMQPVHFVSGAEPRMLLLHGKDDTTVLPLNTRQFADKVNQQGGRADAQFIAGTGHAAMIVALSRAYPDSDQLREKILGFLQD